MSRRRTRFVVLGVLLAFAVVAAVAIPVGLNLRRAAQRDAARAAAVSFARGWQGGSLASVRFEGGTPTALAARVAAATAALTSGATDRPSAVDVVSVSDPQQDRATARLRVRWTLDGGRPWTYETTAALHRAGDAWAVVYAPTLVHPALKSGQTLTVARTSAGRGRVLGARGEVLAGPRAVVDVGLQPGATKDAAASAQALAALVDIDAADLTSRVRAAKPTAFVPAITLRKEAYAPLAAKIKAVPGAVTQAGTLSLGRTATFARALLGSVGPATKEIVAASGGRVRAGDVTGLSGLQRTYDAQLAGRPGLVIRAAASGGTAPASAGTVVFQAPPTAGKDVTTTLDPKVQDAAEAALGAAKQPAALVAIKPSTGDVVAVANGGPDAAAFYDRALLGQYPPGSTFKVVSGYALLQQGYTATTPVPCPPSVTVDGQTIRNSENEVLGTVPFRTDFAESCNAAFVGSRGKVSPQQLAQAAGSLGYGEPDRLGVEAFGGSVPTDPGEVEHAVNMIGQGKVLASPLTVATVSASVAAGERVAPRLVVDPAPSAQPAAPAPSASGSPAGAGTPTASGSALPSAALEKGTLTTLQSLMRAVVTDGTGTALRNVPGGPVLGKTGTAEFGTKNPPDTHAWFTGYQGDLAFAVIVENGGFGAKVAAPIAADLLRRLS